MENGENLDEISGINIIENESNGTTTIWSEEVMSNKTRATSAEKIEILYDVNQDFPAYNAVIKASRNSLVPAMGVYRYVRAYETQDYYIYKNLEKNFYEVGKSKSDIVRDLVELLVPTNAIEKLFAMFEVPFNAAGELDVDIEFYIGAQCEYWFAVEGTVYDTTAENADVQVTVEQDWGTFTYGYNSSHEPEWFIDSTDIADPYYKYYQGSGSYTDVLDEALDGYNSQIELYGVWKWGKGVIGG